MTRETHFRIAEDYGRSISLVYPAADCAIVRMYDKEKDVIGLTHSDIVHTSNNIIGDMVEYMKSHFNSNPEIWNGYIEKIDDTHYNVQYGNRIYNQLVESGLLEDNIYFDSDNTIKDDSYFSNNRFKLLKERDGRNLFGITFDSLPVYERQDNDEINTRLK